MCRNCVLEGSHAQCDNCDKVLPLYRVYDCGGPTEEYLCRDCFLSAVRADGDEVDDYREALEEAAG